MPNTIVNQPTAASLQLTDYLLAWQGSQSPSTRKLPVSGLAGYYLALTGGTLTGGLTITTGGIVVSAGGATITGNSSVTGNLSVSGTATLSSAATVGGTLGVTGAATLASTLAVAGASTLHATTITGAATVSTTFGVTGATTLSSTLAVTGAATLSSTLAVTGAVTLSSTATMPNNTALKMKDSGGTARDILYVSAADLTNIVNAGGSNFQILNQAKNTALFVMSNAGVITLPGSIGINGTTAGSVAGAGQLLTSGAGTGASGPIAYSISCAGSVTGTAIYATSDRRAKSDVEAITPEQGIAYVMAARSVSFRMDGCRGAGFIAQEEATTVRAASVNLMEDSRPEFAESDGVVPAGHRLVKSYEHDIAYLTAALQYALTRIAALEAAA